MVLRRAVPHSLGDSHTLFDIVQCPLDVRWNKLLSPLANKGMDSCNPFVVLGDPGRSGRYVIVDHFNHHLDATNLACPNNINVTVSEKEPLLPSTSYVVNDVHDRFQDDDLMKMKPMGDDLMKMKPMGEDNFLDEDDVLMKMQSMGDYFVDYFEGSLDCERL